ncbi:MULTISPECIES: MFS transporter [Bacillus]|uniref:MFS transporter n=1 Tax=Bacillus cereus TaxID=1396 RepID=A0A2A8J1G9_BACCE|nr:MULTISPECIES: MFS transporter [Bacillus]MDH4421994.1 MFS transporter [Bacillus cereus]PER26068.1 MFS transporter [Bacillus cereus]PFA56703.1 MFS transporter [Bacillus sp. AFS015896]PGL85347.1 MFS transporter [Bacillus sp. AFS054943]PGU00266.1 MFS transporter [Bacillus cereus]
MLMEESVNSTYKWMVLIFATIAQATATLITYGVGAFALFWKEEYVLTNMESGLLISVVNIGPLFCMLFVGRLLDQYNEKMLISISSFLLGGSLLLTNIVNGFIGLLFVLLLVGTFYSVSQPGGSKVIINWFPKENRGLAMGIRQAGIPIGGALAGVLIPFFTIKYNVTYTINIIGSICIIGGLLFYIFYQDPPCVREEEKQERSNISFWMHLKAVICKKGLYSIYITGICMISLQMVLVGHFIKYLVIEQSITPILAGKVFSVMFFSGMIGRVILAAISDLFYKGNRRIPLFITVCTSICFILMLVMSIHVRTNVLYGVSALLGFFSIGWFSLFIAEVAESASEESVGMTVSFALTLNQIAIIVAPVLFGYIVDEKGYTYAWLCIVVLLSISAASLYWKNKK